MPGQYPSLYPAPHANQTSLTTDVAVNHSDQKMTSTNSKTGQDYAEDGYDYDCDYDDLDDLRECAAPPEPSLLFTKIDSFFENNPTQQDLVHVLKSLDNYQELPQLLDSYLYNCIQKCASHYLNPPPDSNSNSNDAQISQNTSSHTNPPVSNIDLDEDGFPTSFDQEGFPSSFSIDEITQPLDAQNTSNQQPLAAGTWPCELIYTLAKVRGAKTISRFLPSDVKYLVEIVHRLELLSENAALSKTDTSAAWQEPYTLLLWLSVSVLAPFPLSTFGESTFQRIYNISQYYLAVPGKERDAAALLTARLVTRQDAKKDGGLLQFLIHVRDNCVIHLANQSGSFPKPTHNSLFYRLGSLATISHICKLLNPAEIYNNIHIKTGLLLDFLLAQSPNELAGGAVYDKLVVKCLSKIGASLVLVDEDDIPETQSYEPSELLELIFQNLTNSLQNSNSIVRYTAAKAVATITSTLPASFQHEVLQNCLDAFEIPQNMEQEESMLEAVPVDRWHGNLLLLAEMIRRKIQLYQDVADISLLNFDRLLCILQFTLRFELQKLTRTVGGPIRDASCYVCWSLFRSPSLWIPPKSGASKPTNRLDSQEFVYHQTHVIPQNFVQSLANSLVNTACFDREINVRRAAAAALQEGIGRLPSSSNNGVPAISKGLDLVQSLDFSHVSVLEKAFTRVFPKVFDLGYHETLDYMIKYTLQSSSSTIRKLVAQSITILLKKRLSSNPSQGMELCKTTLRKIIAKRPRVFNLYAFHGTYYAIGQILIECGVEPFASSNEDESNNYTTLPLNVINTLEIQHGDLELAEVFVHLFNGVLLQKSFYFKDYTTVSPVTDLINNAFNLLLELLKTNNKVSRIFESPDLLSIAQNFPLRSGPLFSQFLDQARNEIEKFNTSNATAKFPNIQIKSQSMGGVKPYNTCLFLSNVPTISKQVVIDLFYKPIVMPNSTFGNREVSTKCLWKAVENSFDILITDSQSKNILNVPLLQAFINGLTDYTTDAKGDVGSWLRKTCILAGREICLRRPQILSLVDTKAQNGVEIFDRFEELYVSNCIRMSCELLDSLRQECVLSLAQVSRYPSIQHYFNNYLRYKSFQKKIEPKELLKYIATEEKSLLLILAAEDSTNWNFVISLLKGLVYSAGAQQASYDVLSDSFTALSAILNLSSPHTPSLESDVTCKNLWAVISTFINFRAPSTDRLKSTQDITYRPPSCADFSGIVSTVSWTPRLAFAALRFVERALNGGVNFPNEDNESVSKLSSAVLHASFIPVTPSSGQESKSLKPTPAQRALYSRLLAVIPPLLCLANLGNSAALERLFELAQYKDNAIVREKSGNALYEAILISRRTVLEEYIARLPEEYHTREFAVQCQAITHKIWQKNITEEQAERVGELLDSVQWKKPVETHQNVWNELRLILDNGVFVS